MSRIIDKLLRPGLATMRLSQMEDIGGCRAVLATIDDLRAVEERIRWRWARRGLVDVIDYIDRPKDDGYPGRPHRHPKRWATSRDSAPD
jgi:ppGpp synthetase/RelA/SpoT-type nucleotidyltranferase